MLADVGLREGAGAGQEQHCSKQRQHAGPAAGRVYSVCHPCSVCLKPPASPGLYDRTYNIFHSGLRLPEPRKLDDSFVTPAGMLSALAPTPGHSPNVCWMLSPTRMPTFCGLYSM